MVSSCTTNRVGSRACSRSPASSSASRCDAGFTGSPRSCCACERTERSAASAPVMPSDSNARGSAARSGVASISTCRAVCRPSPAARRASRRTTSMGNHTGPGRNGRRHVHPGPECTVGSPPCRAGCNKSRPAGTGRTSARPSATRPTPAAAANPGRRNQGRRGELSDGGLRPGRPADEGAFRRSRCARCSRTGSPGHGRWQRPEHPTHPEKGATGSVSAGAGPSRGPAPWPPCRDR